LALISAESKGTATWDAAFSGDAYPAASAVPAKRLLSQHVKETVKVTRDKSRPRFSKVAESHRKITFKGTYSLA